MTEEVKKKRRTREEIKLQLAARIKELDLQQEIQDKREILKLADQASVLAGRRKAQPTLAQAATLLSQAAAAIKADIPQ